MRFASALSQSLGADRAIGELADRLREQLGEARPDLLCLFASAELAASAPQLGSLLAREFPGALLVGCSAQSVLGDGREIEGAPALAAAAASLPGVRLEPFHLEAARLPGAPLPEDAHWLLLADPFSAPLTELLPLLDRRFPRGAKLGALASGAEQPGETALFLGDAVLRSGVIALALHGDLALDTLVAQGCRPVGQPMFVTSAEGNRLAAVDGRPPLETLRELYAAAEPAEQRLYQHSLFLGVEMRAGETRYGQGDYLVRNLLGSDERGALFVATDLTECRVVQFHLRDAEAADADLDQRLARYRALATKPAGVLLFSCLGRGQGLYGVPDHDSRALAAALGPLPVSGFFANGEIGPVEGRTFLHGYTSALGLFRARGSPRAP